MTNRKLPRFITLLRDTLIFFFASPLIFSLFMEWSLNIRPRVGPLSAVDQWVGIVCGIFAASLLLSFSATIFVNKSSFFTSFFLATGACLAFVPDIIIAFRTSYFGIIAGRFLLLLMFFVFCLAISVLTRKLIANRLRLFSK